APTATPTPFATAGPRLTQIAERTASAVIPTATATPAPTETSAPVAVEATPVAPASLPNTGANDTLPRWIAVLALIVLIGGMALNKVRGKGTQQ
ncbi:MAG: hypothetical protein HC822_22040, partial [Oscillochloris sp.]|nr:hypothetical protein [Oscillochloris sp.]